MFLLGLGSNLPSSHGDRFENLNLAVKYLDSYKIKIIKKSSFYETASFPDIKNPKFINMVVHISTYLPPEDLASVLIFIEEKLERKRKIKNEPRTCDIDIIDYNGKVMDFSYKGSIFKVPHEKLIYRNFVLFPLQEIAPNWIHPKTKDSIDVLINKLSNEDKKSILKIKKS
jgi:2-amino-4-hydroxy-6-hydroxymethyldihydropteridine diphosphokinase|tara:strand:- start:1723 stop:2235 length:513 start_codon:yes stop_codon:yes gene_type:complete